MLLAAAIIAAPFIAFAYRVEAGLLVMAVALLATAYLLWSVYATSNVATRRWLRRAIVVDLVLALFCVGLVLFRMINP